GCDLTAMQFERNVAHDVTFAGGNAQAATRHHDVTGRSISDWRRRGVERTRERTALTNGERQRIPAKAPSEHRDRRGESRCLEHLARRAGPKPLVEERNVV